MSWWSRIELTRRTAADDHQRRPRAGRSSSSSSARGFAIDDEENERNIRCVGARRCAITAGRPTHAISVSALTVEVSLEDALTLGPRVVAAAQALSRALGARAA